jgi:phage terminase large subunit-like protein
MTKGGLSVLTFTPLEGMSDVVQAFLPGGRLPGESEF